MMRSVYRLAALAALAGTVACHKDSTGPGGGDANLGTYYGVFGASNGSASVGGTVVIIIVSSGASGTLTPTGLAGIPLSGTYNAGSGAVSVAGGGHTLTGTITSGELDGTYAGSAGAGSFGTHKGTTSSDVSLFCGSYDGDASGVWNLAKTGNSLVGAYADDGGGSARLTGTLSGSSISLTFTGGTASGTLASATAMNGNWTAGAASGTWTGVSPCP